MPAVDGSVEYLSKGNGTNGCVVNRADELVALFGGTPVDQAAAMTAQLTTITPADAAGTPDYAIAAVTSSTPYGLASAAEFITLLYVVQNLQVRVGELEAMLDASTGIGVCV